MKQEAQPPTRRPSSSLPSSNSNDGKELLHSSYTSFLPLPPHQSSSCTTSSYSSSPLRRGGSSKRRKDRSGFYASSRATGKQPITISMQKDFCECLISLQSYNKHRAGCLYNIVGGFSSVSHHSSLSLSRE